MVAANHALASIEVKKSTMPPKLESSALEIISEAVELAVEKDAATQIKRRLDEVHGETWHCIIGKDFGVSLCIEAQCVLFVRISAAYYLVFKSFDVDKAISDRISQKESA